MKKILALLLSCAALGHAALIQLDLSPTNSDFATGLSPANEVPAVTNSTGSGGEISGGIVFDTTSSTLHVAIGYGSAAGFTNLTGAATTIGIHGPAHTNEVGPVVLDLSPYVFPAIDPAKGGVIFGAIVLPPNAVSNLLNGLDYVNVGTESNAMGEIRGQLVASNSVVATNLPVINLPTITCPSPVTVQCGRPAEVTVAVGDVDGEALTVIWTLNGVAVQTNEVAGGTPPTSANVSFSATLPPGTNNLGVAVTGSETNSVSCSTVVTVVDTLPPAIRSASVQPNLLWPPNHQMVEVTVYALVTDLCGSATWKIVNVSASEGAHFIGSGHTTPDWNITGDHTVSLRAERSGHGGGRIYFISIQATDASGNVSATQVVTVLVPKSQGNGHGGEGHGDDD